jgi:hypothetical protein
VELFAGTDVYIRRVDDRLARDWQNGKLDIALAKVLCGKSLIVL